MKLKNLLLEGTITPAAKRCKEIVINKFGVNSFPSIGVYNYRTVAGSKTISEHAYGNALDFHVPDDQFDVATPEGKQLGDRVKDFLLQNTEDLEIVDIIWYRQIWSRPSFTKSYYGGEHPHKDHVHVDFIRAGRSGNNNSKGIDINRKNNKYLTDLIASYYYISSTKKGAEEYFGSFRSWNPFAAGIGDNEEGAANKLLSRFDKYYEPELKRIQSNSATSNEDKKNIQKIREIIDILTQAILNGDSVQFDVLYYEYNVTTKSYIPKSKMFNWNYM